MESATARLLEVLVSSMASNTNTMVSRLSIWTPDTQTNFHRHVAELFKKNTEPRSPQFHPDLKEYDSPDYTLSYREEQQLADDLAFIACVDEGGNSGLVQEGKDAQSMVWADYAYLISHQASLLLQVDLR